MYLERGLSLPAESSTDREATARARLLDSSSACRVLVVDDDNLVRARLCSLLDASRYDVHVAASGEEALRVLKTTPFHIVLTDWQMPDMDGLALCRHARLCHDDGYVYILMLTVRDSKQDMLAGLAAGADDYVVKGASVDEILALLEVGRRITHVDRSQRASNRENQRLLLTDPLTGAYNLRYFVQQLPRELGRSLRYGRPMAILSCAIEGFKPVNDGFGRETGDDLLRAFASRTESCIRKSSDWLARVGDNDFIVVLPETTASAASRVAQKLRQVFTSKPVITRAGPINFTASIGVTAAEVKDELDGGLCIDDILRAADRGLFAGKGGGQQATGTARTGAKNGIN